MQGEPRCDRTARILFHTIRVCSAKRRLGLATIPETGLGAEDRSLRCRERVGSVPQGRARWLRSRVRACGDRAGCGDRLASCSARRDSMHL